MLLFCCCWVLLLTSTEDGSGPGRLLRSVWSCRLSDRAGRCSATWYKDALVVPFSCLVGDPLESSWLSLELWNCWLARDPTGEAKMLPWPPSWPPISPYHSPSFSMQLACRCPACLIDNTSRGMHSVSAWSVCIGVSLCSLWVSCWYVGPGVRARGQDQVSCSSEWWATAAANGRSHGCSSAEWQQRRRHSAESVPATTGSIVNLPKV